MQGSIVKFGQLGPRQSLEVGIDKEKKIMFIRETTPGNSVEIKFADHEAYGLVDVIQQLLVQAGVPRPSSGNRPSCK